MCVLYVCECVWGACRDIARGRLTAGTAETLLRLVQPWLGGAGTPTAVRALAAEALAALLEADLLPDPYAVYMVVVRGVLARGEREPAVRAALCAVAQAILRTPLPPPPPPPPPPAPAPPLDPRQPLRDTLWELVLGLVTPGPEADPRPRRAAWAALATLIPPKLAGAAPNTPWAGGWQQPATPLVLGAEGGAPPPPPAPLEEQLADRLPALVLAAMAEQDHAANGSEDASRGALLAATLAADVAALPRGRLRGGVAAAPDEDIPLHAVPQGPARPAWWPSDQPPYVHHTAMRCKCAKVADASWAADL
jgi:hypothetical protein